MPLPGLPSRPGVRGGGTGRLLPALRVQWDTAAPVPQSPPTLTAQRLCQGSTFRRPPGGKRGSETLVIAPPCPVFLQELVQPHHTCRTLHPHFTHQSAAASEAPRSPGRLCESPLGRTGTQKARPAPRLRWRAPQPGGRGVGRAPPPGSLPRAMPLTKQQQQQQQLRWLLPACVLHSPQVLGTRSGPAAAPQGPLPNRSTHWASLQFIVCPDGPGSLEICFRDTAPRSPTAAQPSLRGPLPTSLLCLPCPLGRQVNPSHAPVPATVAPGAPGKPLSVLLPCSLHPLPLLSLSAQVTRVMSSHSCSCLERKLRCSGSRPVPPAAAVQS